MTTCTTMTKATLLTSLVLWAGGAVLVAGEAAAQDDPGLLVDAEWVQAHIDDRDVAVLHAESRADAYDAGHIAGARFLDMTRLMWQGDPPWGAELRSVADVEEALEEAGVGEETRHLVVYSTDALAAARAFMTLEVMGLRGRVHMLDGGFGGWVAAGRPVSTDARDVSRGRLTLTPTNDIVVSAEWILERLDDPAIALVDARPDREYTGADGGMGGRTHAGHIPGAGQLYWEELVESRSVPRLLDRPALEALFERAGAGEGQTVVTYCMVGLRASFTYFTSRLLGYETKFYDGSWHEWGSRDDLPFVAGRSPR